MKKYKPNTFCHYCGCEYAIPTHPFTCAVCENIVYLNPLPVVVVAVPICKAAFETEDESVLSDTPTGYYPTQYLGYLGVQRGIPPIGEFCLPGGYIEKHETWEDAAVRETFEETGVNIKNVRLESIESINGFLVVFCIAGGVPEYDMDLSFTTEETQQVVVFDEPQTLAFSVQTAFMKRLPF